MMGAIESFVMRRFDVVSTISGRMMERLAAKGVDERRRVFFPNWVDTAAIFPMDEASPLRRELDIPDNALVALYSGSMGAKQGIEQLIDAARLLADRPTIRIVICGDGAGLRKLQEAARDLPNVRFLPLQAPDRLNALLNLADVHVLPQKPSVADLVMPSKLIGMLASGRPVIATARRDRKWPRSCGSAEWLCPRKIPRRWQQPLPRSRKIPSGGRRWVQMPERTLRETSSAK
jgi:colanic acid biosynthesis glycosyl transferase WcaI